MLQLVTPLRARWDLVLESRRINAVGEVMEQQPRRYVSIGYTGLHQGGPFCVPLKRVWPGLHAEETPILWRNWQRSRMVGNNYEAARDDGLEKFFLFLFLTSVKGGGRGEEKQRLFT